MRSPNLQLTVTKQRLSITPLPGHIETGCTFDEHCQRRASHRLLVAQAAGAKLLCDDHTVAWALDHGLCITTARLTDQAASVSAEPAA
jgi:hypothetical protein